MSSVSNAVSGQGDPHLRGEAPPAGQLRALQEQRLRLQVHYAYAHSPFYRGRLERQGLHPGAIGGLDDLALLPLTTGAELVESQLAHPPLGLQAAAPPSAVVRIYPGAGPGGLPRYSGLTRHDWATWLEAAARACRAQGIGPGDVVVVALGAQHAAAGELVQHAAAAIGATAVPADLSRPRQLIATVVNLGADTLVCSPDDALALADYLRDDLGVEPAALGLRRLALYSEAGSGLRAVRRALEADWGATVTAATGRADVLPLFAADCSARDGVHLLAPDLLIAELVAPESGLPLPAGGPGPEGELVLTHLDHECAPVLRLRTGDLVAFVAGPCPCGRPGQRLRRLGRVDELLSVGGVAVRPAAIRDLLLELRPRATGAVQVVQAAPGARVEPPLRVLVEYGPQVRDLAGFRRDVEAHIRRGLSVEAEAQPMPPGTLPR